MSRAIPNSIVVNWGALIFRILLGFALFPNYATSVLGTSADPSPSTAAANTVTVGISGMTCEACTLHVYRELSQVPGVLHVSVSYPQKKAVVSVDSATAPSEKALAWAVEKAGYKAVPNEN